MEIEIKDTKTGRTAFSVLKVNSAGIRKSWSSILEEISCTHYRGISNLDFTGLINEQVRAKSIKFYGCVIDLDNMERSIFLDCTFENCVLKSSSFHHIGDRSDRGEKSLGALFRRCKFIDCQIIECDFVMSKFFQTTFLNSKITNCDMRNIFWIDRTPDHVQTWSDLPEYDDPFKNCKMTSVIFGHPISNIMALPMTMMIPKSYSSVWGHMGALNRRITKLSYHLSEEKREAFSSSL